jgi:zinc and cadmium transporter
MVEALLAALGVASCSLVGALFFGVRPLSHALERFIVPVAVGVFLALALYGVIPEVIEASPEWGGLLVAIGFIAFYVVAYIIHERLHLVSEEFCEKREAAILILIGDAIHNFADGIVIGGAFLIAPEVGLVTAAAIAFHEIPQEIVEFGVLMRAGYTRPEALVRNFISASTVVVGTLATMLLAQSFANLVWVLSALAAGNLLYIAAAELLPRLHGSLKLYGGFWNALVALLLGFATMAVVVHYAHDQIPHDVHDGVPLSTGESGDGAPAEEDEEELRDLNPADMTEEQLRHYIQFGHAH